MKEAPRELHLVWYRILFLRNVRHFAVAVVLVEMAENMPGVVHTIGMN